MNSESFKTYMSKKCPNTCGRSDEREREVLAWHMFGPECDKGWWELFEIFCEEVEKIYEEFGVGVFIQQFKEKFGAPRLYIYPCYTKEVAEILNSAEDSKQKKILEILTDYTINLSFEVEKEMQRVSELTGNDLPGNFDNFSYNGWIWGTSPEEVIAIYSEKLEEITEEKEKKKCQDIIERAHKQESKNKTIKKIKYLLEDYIRLSDIDELTAIAKNIELLATSKNIRKDVEAKKKEFEM